MEAHPMSRDVNDIVIGPYQKGDETEILRVFTKVFGVTRSLDAWTWQYANNPAGLHCFLARFPDGQVVSQFCSVPRRVRVRDRTFCFAEIVDSFTDPDFRQGLKKPGLFASTCYAYVDAFGRPEEEVIMYGLPNPPAYRVGSRLLGYVHFYKVELLSRRLEEASPLAAEVPGGSAATVVDRASTDIEGLFQRLATWHPVLTVRDALYLHWRYADRPDASYEQIEYRDRSGRLFAYTALRHRWLDQPETAVAEIMVDRDHPSARSVIVDVEARARAAGSERLRVMLRPESPEWTALHTSGYVPEKSQFRLVARTYDKETIPLDWLRDNWYVTLGDFDIV
jgi:hypothetical protein